MSFASQNAIFLIHMTCESLTKTSENCMETTLPVAEFWPPYCTKLRNLLKECYYGHQINDGPSGLQCKKIVKSDCQ